jgi:bifunctional enzyme CysN/CysC
VPHFGHEFEAVLVWMNEDALKLNHEYLIKCGTNLVPGFVNNVQYRFDINTLHRQEAPTLTVNAIGRVTVSVTRPIAFDAYARNRATGAFIVIDRVTNGTLAAGMILERDHSVQPRRAVSDKPVSAHVQTETSLVQPADRARLLRQKPATLWFTGLSGSGKSTIAKRVERLLFERGHAAFILDGDNVRQGLNRDLGFSSHDRTENIRRVAEVARLFNDAGLLAITSFISPYLADRQNARAIVGDEPFIEIFVKAPIEVCERRDPKGLYRKARSGQIAEFTGISAPYEPPTAPELTIETDVDDVEACARRVIAYLEEEGIIPAA